EEEDLRKLAWDLPAAPGFAPQGDFPARTHHTDACNGRPRNGRAQAPTQAGAVSALAFRPTGPPPEQGPPSEPAPATPARRPQPLAQPGNRRISCRAVFSRAVLGRPCID